MNEENFEIDLSALDMPQQQEQQAPAPAQQAPAPVQPEATPPPSVGLGPLSARLQNEINETERRYQEALSRKKQLMDAGYSVPSEVEMELASYTAKREMLRLSLDEAIRRDAMAQVPNLTRSLLQNLPPNVAKIAESHLTNVLNSIAINNPDVLRDQAAMQNAVNLAVGLAVKEQMEKKMKTPSPTAQATGVSQIPAQSQPVQRSASLQELSSKMGYEISQKSWDAVANADPDEPLPLF